MTTYSIVSLLRVNDSSLKHWDEECPVLILRCPWYDIRISCMIQFYLVLVEFNPLNIVGQLLVPHFEKGRSEKNECLWGLSSCHRYLPGELTMFLLKKKTLENKIWHCGLNFKCWSWPVLAKPPINVVLVILKYLQ